MKSGQLFIRVPDPLLGWRLILTSRVLSVTEGVLAVIAAYVGHNESLPLVERVSLIEKRLVILKNNIFVR